MSLGLDQFKNRHAGHRGYIVGKGPSLDTIASSEALGELEGAVVFCLNESIHQIEALDLNARVETPLYCVQQDSELCAACVPHHDTTIHFMNDWQAGPQDRGVKKRVTQSGWNSKAILYRSPEWHLSGMVAIDIMALMGIRDVTLVCFDALLNNYKGPETYARCITTPPGIHKSPGYDGPHRGSGRQIVQRARELMRSLKTIHPHAPDVEFLR